MFAVHFAALVLLAAAPQDKAATERVAVSLRVVGPMDMTSAGEKGKNIDLYRVFIAFENTTDEPATVFAPDIAKRPELANDFRFKGRSASSHHYAVKIRDEKGSPVENAHFAVFVGGFSSSIEGGDQPPRVCEYKEEWDLLRLDKRQKVERPLGYIMTRRGTKPEFTTELALKTDAADESDAEALRLIRLAGPDKREWITSTKPTPERTKPATEKSPQRTLPPPPPPKR